MKWQPTVVLKDQNQEREELLFLFILFFLYFQICAISVFFCKGVPWRAAFPLLASLSVEVGTRRGRVLTLSLSLYRLPDTCKLL